MTEEKKSTWGGPGRSPGRHLKYGEKSVLVTVSVPASREDDIKRLFNKYLKRYENKQPNKKAKQIKEAASTTA